MHRVRLQNKLSLLQNSDNIREYLFSITLYFQRKSVSKSQGVPMPPIKNRFHLHFSSPALVKFTIEQFHTSQPKAESSSPPLSSETSLTYQSQHCYPPPPPPPQPFPRSPKLNRAEGVSEKWTDCESRARRVTVQTIYRRNAPQTSGGSRAKGKQRGKEGTEMEARGVGKGSANVDAKGGCHGTWRWNDK